MVTAKADAADTVNENDTVAVCGVGAAESVTVTEKVEVPAVVGVPERRPVELRVRPAGGAPVVTAQERAPVPPVAANCWL